MAAYAVAQMRITQTLREQDTNTQLGDLRLHLADTLADPYERSTLFTFLPAGDPLVENSRQADWIKREEKVTVMIGNPPDRERAEGEGGWVEKGHEAENIPPLLDAFRLGGRNGTQENKLKNLYVYFWRWATYKVFDQHRPESHRGIVAFISTAGFLSGPGFRGMREYLRRTCTEGWIIELSPERIQPPARTHLFEGVQQQLAIAVFVRSGVDDKPAAGPVKPLPGSTQRRKSILEADPECSDPVPVAYRPFDREWIIPDNRVLDRCSPDLWDSRLGVQVYLVEQHSKCFGEGPAVLFTALMPDLDHFDGRGGRVLPLLQKEGSPSVAPGLLPHLRNSYGDLPVTAEDLAAYIAAITAHPGFRKCASTTNSPPTASACR
jgi:hypothetical protein